jgi:hypothetical protein
MSRAVRFQLPREMTYAEWVAAGYPAHDDWRVEGWTRDGYFVLVNGQRVFGPHACKGLKNELSRVLHCSRCKVAHKFELALYARHEGALGRTMYHFSPLPCRVRT